MKELFLELEKQYGIHVDGAQPVLKGFLSENQVIVSGQTKYFLKQYRFKLSQKVAEVHAAKAYFSSKGIPVIMPLKTTGSNGQTYFSFNERHYALFPFIEGFQPERGEMADTQIVSMGKMLGRIHLAGKDAPTSEQFSLLSGSTLMKDMLISWDKDKFLVTCAELETAMKKSLGGKRVEEDAFYELASEAVRFKKVKADKNTIQRDGLKLPSDHLVHGDYVDQNVFFDNEGNVSHVFDFEKAEFAPRGFELVRSTLYSFLNTFPAPKEDMRKARLYLDSYRSMYPMSDDELKRSLLLFHTKSLHSVWVEKEHYFQNSTRTDHFLRPDFARTKYIAENFDSFSQELIWK